MTISDFILARVTEEEDLAHAALDGREPDDRWDSPSDGEHFNRWNPWRVQSACLVRRQIVRAHADAGPQVVRVPGATLELRGAVCSTCRDEQGQPAAWPCYTMRVLASEWADHPDYRHDWRPGSFRRPAAGAGAGRRTGAPHAPGQRGA
jgi:hypothetical protein